MTFFLVRGGETVEVYTGTDGPDNLTILAGDSLAFATDESNGESGFELCFTPN